jgi:hypothetical protein
MKNIDKPFVECGEDNCVYCEVFNTEEESLIEEYNDKGVE